LSEVEQFLRHAGRDLRAHADEQRRAGNMGGGGRGSRVEPCMVTPEAARRWLKGHFAASRSYVADRVGALDRMLARVDALVDEVPPFVGFVVAPNALALWMWSKSLRTERRNLARLEDVEHRNILSVSGAVGDERITEVYGDLGNPDRVIIHVPGMTTDLGDYARGHSDALALKAAAERESGLKVAVISFGDYDIPQSVASAAMAHGAEDGASKLRSLVSDLHSAGFRTDQISVVGHSYGSVVVGHAMTDGLDVRKVITAGSPGMGVQSRADLGSPSVHLAAVDPGSLDIVTDDLGGWGHAHGLSPNNGNFGADSIIRAQGNVGHSGYFKGGTGAAIAKAAVN
jgi:hypothetical protein